MKETISVRDVPTGEFFQTPNGNIYLRLPNMQSVYICNEDLSRSDKSDWLDDSHRFHTQATVLSFTRVQGIIDIPENP